MSAAQRTPIYGPEPWLEIGGVVWSHWDLWFCVLSCQDHDGDLAALGEAITDEHRRIGASDTERKLSHLDDLVFRLRAASLHADSLAGRAEDRPALRTKARTKVLKQGLRSRDLTDPMSNTPRERLYQRALHGRWSRFPASPQPWYDRMVDQLGERWLHKSASSRLARRIENLRDRNDSATASDPAQRLAARRALVTYLYETMGRCDDSYGVLGELGQEALITYAKLPHGPTGIVAEDWCEDLCELVTWERYGLLLDHETSVFAKVHGALAEHAEKFLFALADELLAHRLPYEAGEAQQNVAHLHIAQGRVSRFAAVAATLGSDHWQPVVAMAEAALARGRPDVVRATFAAADQPGMHQEHLRRRSIEMTGAPPHRD